VASWILTPPGDLTGDDRAALAQITGRCEELKQTVALVCDFADMLCHRHGEHLEAWARRAEASPVSELRGFSKGLRHDWAAVTSGLTVSYSSGAVEGHVNRIKMIKRQMYGRAKPTRSASASCSPTDPGHDNWARATKTWPLTVTRRHESNR
jgi:transposase